MKIENSGVYSFGTYDCFPLDGLGFDGKELHPDETQYNGRSFHFCLRISNQFVYREEDYFNLSGDDDDNKLIKPPILTRDVIFKDVPDPNLKILSGQTYDFDFFYCERHTANSDLFITTNVNFTCKHYDRCGVFDGTCYQITDMCDTNSTCYTGECLYDECIYTEINCDDNDEFTIDSCLEGTGCIHLPVRCDDSNDCTLNSCDSQIPINYTQENPLVVSYCENGICVVQLLPTDNSSTHSTSSNQQSSTDQQSSSSNGTPSTPSPTPSPSSTPIPTPSISIDPVPKYCLACEDLNYNLNRCTYY